MTENLWHLISNHCLSVVFVYSLHLDLPQKLESIHQHLLIYTISVLPFTQEYLTWALAVNIMLVGCRA